MGDRIRAKRIEIGLRQKDVAAMIGVTEDTICHWENNRVSPSANRYQSLLKFMKMSP